MELVIRRANEKDFTGLRELYHQVDALHHRALPQLFKAPDDILRTSEFIQEQLSQEETLLLVAERSGQVIGFVLAVIHQRDHPLLIPFRVVHIDEIVVDEQFFGTGLAQKLVEQVDRWAQEKDAREIQLQVFEFNQRAVAFYEKVGFTTASRRMWREVTWPSEDEHDPIRT